MSGSCHAASDIGLHTPLYLSDEEEANAKDPLLNLVEQEDRRVGARTEDTRSDPQMISRWEGVAWPSATERSHVLSALPPSQRPFTPFPGVDLHDVYRFLDRQRPGRS